MSEYLVSIWNYVFDLYSVCTCLNKNYAIAIVIVILFSRSFILFCTSHTIDIADSVQWSPLNKMSFIPVSGLLLMHIQFYSWWFTW